MATMTRPNAHSGIGNLTEREADQMLAFALGLTSMQPVASTISLSSVGTPDRVRDLIQTALDRNGVKVTRLAAKKEDRRSQVTRGAQEEGDADSDEGHDVEEDERPGSAKRFEPDGSRGVKPLEGNDGPPPGTTKKSPGGSSTTDGPRYEAEDQDTAQKDYQDEEEAVHDRSKKSSERGTPVQSPGSEKSAIGPMGGKDPKAGITGKLATPYVSRPALRNGGINGGMQVFANGLTRQLAVNELLPQLAGRPRR